MGFRNPIVIADEIASGNFAGAYTIDGSFTVGDAPAARVVLGVDSLGADGIRLYDGLGDVVVDLRADTGVASFKGTVEIGSSLPPIGGGNLWTRSRPSTLPDPLVDFGGASHNPNSIYGPAGGPAAWEIDFVAGANNGVSHADHLPVKPNTTYTASCWVNLGSEAATLPLDIELLLNEYDATGTFTGNSYGPNISLTTRGVWQRFSATFTTGPTAAQLRAAVQFQGGFTPEVANIALYGLQLEEANIATAYAPAPAEAAGDLLGGTAYGTTAIAGQLVVGDPAHQHVVIGSDGAGADGLRLYDTDGATAIADLSLTGPAFTLSGSKAVITAATIETAAGLAVGGATAGIKLSSSATEDTITLYAGNAAETAAGLLQTNFTTTWSNGTITIFNSGPFSLLNLQPSAMAGGHVPLLTMRGGNPNNHPESIFTASADYASLIGGTQARLVNGNATVQANPTTSVLNWHDAVGGSDYGVTVANDGTVKIASGTTGFSHTQKTTTFGNLTIVTPLGLNMGNGTTGGSNLFNGAGAPPSALGSGGDFYLRWDGSIGTNTLLYYRRNDTNTWQGIL